MLTLPSGLLCVYRRAVDFWERSYRENSIIIMTIIIIIVVVIIMYQCSQRFTFVLCECPEEGMNPA